MKDSNSAEELYTGKASLCQKVFIGFLHWDKQLANIFKKSSYLQSNIKVLDAGCGTGVVTKSLYQIAEEKSYCGVQFYAFDLTESMLEIFRKWITQSQVNNIKLAKTDVLDTKSLPIEWRDFDLIISSAMLEYLPREKVKDALTNLRQCLDQKAKSWL